MIISVKPEDKYLEISPVNKDVYLFAEVVNQGIDSRLEAFTKLEISNQECYPGYDGNPGYERIVLKFHPDEYQILIRRLVELGEGGYERAARWADDIVETIYEVEIL